MRILHVSTEDISGGAARATYRLHAGLRRLGHESSMLVVNRRSNDPTVLTFEPGDDLRTRFRRRIRREQISRDFERYQKSRPAGFEIFSDDRSEYGTDLLRQLPSCDVINLHWIARYVDYEAFFSIVPRQTPVVWRLADMNPLTGGCHVDEGCGKYRAGCGSCPQLGSTDEKDLSNKIWNRKDHVFRTVQPGRLHFVTMNRWMAKEVRQHPFLRRFPVTVIPNGVDTESFKPRDRGFARDVLGLPRDANILLFVAVRAEIRYKGLPLLAQALAALPDVSNLLVVSIGIGAPRLDGRIPHVHLGYVTDDRLLLLAYSAADLYVVPSLHDNSPNTVLEAMACGIPVVGFSVAGIPDMILHGTTGLLVPPKDTMALRAAILELVQDPGRRNEMAAHCRRIAVEEYSLELQARRYSELYKSLL